MKGGKKTRRGGKSKAMRRRGPTRAKGVPDAARRWTSLVLGAIALLTIAAAVVYLRPFHPDSKSVGQDKPLPRTAKASSLQTEKPDGEAGARFVGRQACRECHATEYRAWERSQHAHAMQHANEESVAGDFDDAKFTYSGITSTFFKHDGKFFVNTDGPDGRLQDYEVRYTFGVWPLQQYLIELPGGRLQALSIAWDTRPKGEGGQRWIHLYPNERVTHQDELHWTRLAQNWNYTCADCHSTHVKKGYDAAANAYETTYAEINVSCEACHGPGSQHLSWAGAKSYGSSQVEDEAKGLTVSLDERREATWKIDMASGNARGSSPEAKDREIGVCAQCHSRRSQIAEGYEAGKPFLDHYRPALLVPPLYHVDGQQQGEVYKWGSFLQSKMYARGVTCSDCHDPHSGKLRAQGNAVCATCHLPAKYDTKAHHHHELGTPAAACAACHMPTTTYMVIDPRHDHSLRVPRPDLSVELGTPNACNGCHTNRDARWATARVREWYGHDSQGYQQFASALHAAETGGAHATAQLRKVVLDPTQPAIARATALARLDAPGDTLALETVAEGLRDPDPLVRFGAVQALSQAPQNARVSLAAPLVSDPVRAVRMEAVGVLAAMPAAQLSHEQRVAFERAAREYVETQRYNADRPEARVNLGTFYANRGDFERAQEELNGAIQLEPSWAPSYVNLADLYRVRGRDVDAERILREGLKIAPMSAVLHHALGLALVRMKRIDEAVPELEQAARLDPGSARFAYVYAVALHSTGKLEAAIATLTQALAVHPNDRDILEALASFHYQRGEIAEAKEYAARLRTLSSGDKSP